MRKACAQIGCTSHVIKDCLVMSYSTDALMQQSTNSGQRFENDLMRQHTLNFEYKHVFKHCLC